MAQLTGSPVWDGVASILIGVLLAVVAISLARDNRSLLIGEAVPAAIQQAFVAELESVPSINRVLTIFTSVLSPKFVLVAAKVDFADHVSGARIEAAAEEAERRLRERFPRVRYVFLDPTSSGSIR